MKPPSELVKRIGFETMVALGEQAVLERIRRYLQSCDEGGKVPITGKYTFSTDKEGILQCEIKFTGSPPLRENTITLRDDGKQLRLAFEETAIPKAPLPPEPPPAPSKPEPEPEPMAAKNGAPGRGEARLGELRDQAIEMFKAGEIDENQAKQAGIPSDVIARIKDSRTGADAAQVEDLSPEELAKLQTPLA